MIMDENFTNLPMVEIKIEGETSQKRRATETPETPLDLTKDD